MALVVPAGAVAWRATGPRVDLGAPGLTGPMHVGELYKIGLTVDVRSAGRTRLAGVAVADGPASLRARFWVHRGQSSLGSGEGELTPEERVASRPAAGAEVRDGDTLIAASSSREPPEPVMGTGAPLGADETGGPCGGAHWGHE